MRARTHTHVRMYNARSHMHTHSHTFAPHTHTGTRACVRARSSRWLPAGLLLWSLMFTMRKDEAAMVARLQASVARHTQEGQCGEEDQVGI